MPTPILGLFRVLPETVKLVAERHAAHARYHAVIPLYYRIAPRYRVRPEVALAQAAHETGWGRFSGVVPPEFHNWCGLKVAHGGADDDPFAHARFPDDETGVLAHVQHLAAYAGGPHPQAVGDPVVDPRLALVSWGSAPLVEDLGKRWAPDRNYGLRIAAIVREFEEEEQAMAAYPTRYPGAQWIPSPYMTPGRQAGRNWPSTVDTVVMHHTDGTKESVIQTFTNSPRRVSAHFLVCRDGSVIQFVDLADVAWHAGEWTMNVRSVGIEHEHYRTGSGWSSWTAEQLTAASRLLAWLESVAGRRLTVLRHRDVVATECPGDLPVETIVQRAREGGTMEEKRYFPETGHWLAHGFKAFWEAHGGLPIFGYPISEEYRDERVTCELPNCRDRGKPHVVQYFERARFEWHPGVAPEDFDVLLGRVGAELAEARGLSNTEPFQRKQG